MSTNIHLESPLGEVPHEWRFDYLRNLVFKIGSGATPRGGDSTYLARRENFALVRSQNVFDRHFDDIGLAYISDEQARQLRGVQLSPNDVLLNITGDGITFARACIVPEHVLPACVNQHVSIIRTDPDVCSPGYLLAYLTHPAIKSYIESFNAGGSRRAITKGHIESLVVPLPPLHVQRAIAAILSGFDDKIDLNRRMNATLEATARALFQSWFVDFDPVRAKAEGRQPEGMDAETAALFPDSFEDSVLGWIPRGWRISTIGEEVRVYGGSTPSTKEPRFWENGTHAWATPKDLSDLSTLVLLGTSRQVTDEGIQQISSGLLPAGTVLLSSRAPIGYLAITAIPMAINQGFIAMVCDRRLSNYYTLMWTAQNMDTIKGKANGTTFMEISKGSFRPIPALVPSDEVLHVYNQIAAPLFDQIVKNEWVSRTLAETRDALLPRLISGEVRVGDWQDEFSEVIE
jgi:type I restriction enzyme, S subunit